MDIMNELPDKQFEQLDDLLAFVSIYDDDLRKESYFRLLESHEAQIKGAVCAEAGCGFGLMAEKMAQLGARRVYAIEANHHLYEIARQRLRQYKDVVVIHADIRDFKPPEPVSILVHEFFGQLLFDEDINVLNQLQFKPAQILPNKAILELGLLNSADFVDDVVTYHVLSELHGALVSGLFEGEDVIPDLPVMQWRPGLDRYKAEINLEGREGDLLCFGLKIYHNEKFICRAEECDNWSYVWTPRVGDVFRLEFEPGDRGAEVKFSWV